MLIILKKRGLFLIKPKIDLRILKTRKAIKESFLRLVQTKEYERITIQDIANQAMINRNTFYLHYEDKSKLMENICQESIEKLNVCIPLESERVEEADRERFISSLILMLTMIKEDNLLYKTMLSENVQPHFTGHLKEAFKKIIVNGLAYQTYDQKMEVSLEYIVSGLVGVICMWISNSDNLDIEVVIEQLSEIHFSNIVEVAKKH